MNRTLFALLSGLVLVLPAPADNLAVVKDKDIAARCDEYMQARIKYGKFNGSVLLARDGKMLYEKGFGFADAENDVPNTPQTKFRLASVSKQFTATAIMILEHEGKLKVEDPISKYVPDVPEAWGQVTLHQLMSHTGGVPENLRIALFKGLWPQPIDRDHLFDHIKKLPLDFKPGEKWSYSNTGYALLGLVIDKVSGMPYGDFLKQRIFDPLEMNDTGVDNRRLVLKHRAHGYGMSNDKLVQALYIDLAQVYSAGSLYSTVEDLLKWDNGLTAGKILPPESLKRMWTPVKDNYGYGWLIVDKPRTIMTHDGGLPGFITTVARFPNEKVYVTVLCNLEGSAVPRVARDLVRIAMNEPYDVPVLRHEARVDPKSLDALVGEYQFDGKRKLSVSRKADELYAQLTGQGRFRILPESELKYFARAEELTIAFTRDEKGAVTGLTLHQNGRDTQAKRLPKDSGEKSWWQPR
jgi:CubicO group peptidase (beta-lactamase class C family)